MLTLSSDAHAVGVAVRTRRPIMHHSVHGNHCGCFLRLTVQMAAFIRVRVLVRQPVVFLSFMLIKWIPDFTLILPEVGQRRTLFSVAKFELIAVSKACAPPVGWSWVVAAPGSKPDSAPTRPGAAAEGTPGSPAAILSQHVRGQLHAETLETVLQRETVTFIKSKTKILEMSYFDLMMALDEKSEDHQSVCKSFSGQHE